jgi:hypothetical protein
MTVPLLDAAGLRDAVEPPAVALACTCSRWVCPSWESVTERPGEPQFACIGTLRVPGEDEPTLTEWHPQGTRYGSPRAPISVRHFPFNRCEVWRCRTCGRGLLQYTEYGGYYIDHRVREIDPALVCE